jgi:kynurenine formamidase
VNAAEFRALFDELRTWGAWPEHPERGALNLLGAEQVAAAARLVRTGQTVSLSLPMSTEVRPDSPQPAEHRMTMMPDEDIGAGSVRFAKDYIGADYHSEGHTHLDAFSHVSYEGSFYGGVPDTSVTESGAASGAVELLVNGLIGRAALLDIPRLRGVAWLEAGSHVLASELEEAEHAQGTTVGAGDILLVRTGHAAHVAAHPEDAARGKPGLHPTAARFLAERGVAALGSDGNNDAAPSITEDVGFPIHVLALNALGVHLLDYLQFEDAVPVCERERRWEFLFAAVPLRIRGGTGSPLNPIAVF